MKTTIFLSLQDIIAARNRGELDFVEFIDTVVEWAEDTENEAVLAAIDRFDEDAEDDEAAAEEAFEKEVEQIAAGLVTPLMALDFDASFPNAVTPAQLASLSQPGLQDYTPGMTYQYAVPVMQVNAGTAAAPVWEWRYDLRTYTTDPKKSQYELMEYKRRIKQGNIYLTSRAITSWNLGITTTAANFAATITLKNPVSLVVDWGDGTVNTYTSGTQATHTYVATGNYTVKISGGLAADGAVIPGFDGTNNNLSAVISTTTVIASATGDFANIFRNCAGLTTIPTGIFDKCPNLVTVNSAFRGSGITAVPAKIFDKTPLLNNAASAFMDCAALVTIPAGLFKNCNKVTTYSFTFSGSAAITGTLDTTFINLAAPVVSFDSTFDGCTKLTGTAQTIWVTYPSAAHANTFRGCNLLTNFASIPIDWKATAVAALHFGRTAATASPTRHSAWDVGTPGQFDLAGPYDASAGTTLATVASGAVAPRKMLGWQYTTKPLPAQTLTGVSVRAAIRLRCSIATQYGIIYLRLLNNNGTVAAEIASIASTSAILAGTYAVMTFPDTLLGTLNIAEGQRLCVEVGSDYRAGSATNATTSWYNRSTVSGGDLPYIDGETATAGSSWLSFDKTFYMY